MCDVIVIGAGAAGMLAAAEAARRGAHVVLLEKNGKTGVKILMSGGTRCNITHDTDARGITEAFGSAKRFLQSSVGSFPPSAVVQMFHDQGVQTKVESTGKVFPVSDRAVQVRDALEAMMHQSGTELRLKTSVTGVQPEAGRWIVQTDSLTLACGRVIVTSGGRSWPGCGTTGDAYAWLKQIGHTIVPTRPALVPLVGGTPWMQGLSGLTLDETTARVFNVKSGGKKRRPLIERSASWLFTHFGFSGPAAMDVSGTMTAAQEMKDVQLELDVLPAMDKSQFVDMLTSGGQGNRSLSKCLAEHLPSRLAEAIVAAAGGDCRIAELPKARLASLVDHTKRLRLPVSGTRGFAKAEVTAGGVSLKEVDPRTMESRVTAGLYIAGEVLDVDGWIGGFNFQSAFSTGRAAGIAAATT